MTVTLNHTIVVARNKVESATLLSEILGLAPPECLGHEGRRRDLPTGHTNRNARVCLQ
jgi:hypothetical protein